MAMLPCPKNWKHPSGSKKALDRIRIDFFQENVLTSSAFTMLEVTPIFRGRKPYCGWRIEFMLGSNCCDYDKMGLDDYILNALNESKPKNATIGNLYALNERLFSVTYDLECKCLSEDYFHKGGRREL